ncbi:MAG: hypothetical protein JWQ87_3219 [Candidatus Sulfotelmatobacter sp.]|nr:hypothetical protein [Candidatus Sulfotelmatobacter sp.]
MTLTFGQVPIGQMERLLVVLSNSSQTSVTVSASKSTGTEFSVSGLSLPLILSPGESAVVGVTFSPTTSGWTAGKVLFNSNASNPTLQLRLQGTGTTSDALTAVPSTASFGNIALGTSSTLPIVLTNNHRSSVKVFALQETGSEFSVNGPSLPTNLQAGQSITVKVTFTPQTAGTSGGSVFVTGPALVIPLTGTGTVTTLGQLGITPSPINFGNVPVGTTQTQTLTMSATGASVTVSSDASSNSQFSLEGASLPFTIPAGQNISFNVAFAPKASGTISGSLAFTSNASNSQVLESLTGAGTVTPHSVDLSWNAAPNVAGYNIYRSITASGTYTRINSTLDPNTAYSDSTVVSGQTYYYEATSVNSAGQESTRSEPPVAASIP